MKRHFYFIRHGESESNAGEKTTSPHTIQLTPKGHAEAQQKAASFSKKPGLIITSRYVRTKQTASYFLEKFGDDTPQEEWNIHEFTYLPVARYQNTTNIERYPSIKAYWEKSDPFYKEDTTSESFAEFVERCKEAVERMKECDDLVTVAFSHGYMMNGILFLLAGKFNNINSEIMREFWEYHTTNKIDNCAVLGFDVDDQIVTFKGHDMKKLPKSSPPFIID